MTLTIVELKSLTGPGLCSTADVLTVIQDDRPFLVDSVMGELAEAGVTVRSMFHPIVEGPNGRTSIIIAVLDALPQERRDVLAEALAQTLSDVRAAVTDHAAMQALIGQSIAHLEATPAGTDPEVLAENLAFLRWLQADLFGVSAFGTDLGLRIMEGLGLVAVT